MKATHYAEAIVLASQGKDEEALERIASRAVSLMKENGHGALLPNVVREVERLTKRNKGSTSCTIHVAKKEDVETAKQRIVADIATLGAQSLPKTLVVDTSLVGGYEVRANGKRIDRTYKRTLLSLYNTLLTNH